MKLLTYFMILGVVSVFFVSMLSLGASKDVTFFVCAPVYLVMIRKAMLADQKASGENVASSTQAQVIA
ncbi:MAG: hypothetical protein RSD49_17205 [Hafnia sp.]